jgi:three-Cys-motif partner protein
LERLVIWRSARIRDHSLKKLELIREYVIRYLEILCQNNHGKTSFPITLVDGFSGGGIYAEKMHGSPFVLIQAVQEAEFLINQGRTKKIAIDAEYFFVDNDKSAFECLEHQFNTTTEYSGLVGNQIRLIRDDFDKTLPIILSRIKERHPRGGGRSIFLLDQCGYTAVTADLVKSISKELNYKCEFIINFAIGWLNDLLYDEKGTSTLLSNLGLSDFVDASSLVKIKNEVGDWRFSLESTLGEAFQRASEIPHFSPFYIEPEGNHRGYWLLHLAPKQRARSAMTEIHWQKANRSRHYGNNGIDIFAYKPDSTDVDYFAGMSFDEVTKKECHENLLKDLPKFVKEYFPDGTNYKTFSSFCCNNTIATSEMIEKALQELRENREISIVTPSRRYKSPSVALNGNDLIASEYQGYFSFPQSNTS